MCYGSRTQNKRQQMMKPIESAAKMLNQQTVEDATAPQPQFHSKQKSIELRFNNGLVVALPFTNN